MLFVFSLFIYQYLHTGNLQIWKSYILLRENTRL